MEFPCIFPRSDVSHLKIVNSSKPQPHHHANSHTIANLFRNKSIRLNVETLVESPLLKKWSGFLRTRTTAYTSSAVGKKARKSENQKNKRPHTPYGYIYADVVLHTWLEVVPRSRLSDPLKNCTRLLKRT